MQKRDTSQLQWTIPSSTPIGTITFQDIMDEITTCFSAIKTKGKELGIEINSSAISGYSAGGHLALLYAYSRKSECPIPLKFVAVQAGPTDFHPDSWTTYGEQFLIASLFKYSGVKVTSVNSVEAEKAINSISPLSFVNANSVPTLLAYGTADTTVYPIHYQKLTNALSSNNVTYDLLEFKGAEHFLFVDTAMQMKYDAKLLEYAKQYLK
ncbi:MAG: prolyl oligopeptidase family serine peptidase [Clostridia bacterium]|nr:prolyl oligopeptidase family serine peptidase [Clostridia bacterium]